MLHLLICDIRSDKSRKKVADRLLDLGLIRARYSIFIGTANANRIDEPKLCAEQLLAAKDRLYIIPISRQERTRSRQIGPGIDPETFTANAYKYTLRSAI